MNRWTDPADRPVVAACALAVLYLVAAALSGWLPGGAA
jgi:hypothetical protein